MRLFCKTDTGKVREENEDSYSVGKFTTNESVWAVVCDGMGGVNGGVVASTTAVNYITDSIEDMFDCNMNDNQIKNLMMSLITAANIQIYKKSEEIEELHGMGTTIVLAIYHNGIIHVAHVGDSRAYKISNDVVIQLTTDHSVVQQMVETGEITEENIKTHPKRNLITRALGVDMDVKIDYCEDQVQEGDAVLLCTDGLTNHIDSTDILRVLQENPIEQVADKLVMLANKHGGSDNITTVILYK